MRKLSYTSDESTCENEKKDLVDIGRNYIYVDTDTESESDSINEFINDSENLTEYSSEEEIEIYKERFLRSKKKCKNTL